jgi:hypothetical protein
VAIRDEVGDRERVGVGDSWRLEEDGRMRGIKALYTRVS